MMISFSDGETLHGKEAEKFSFLEDALKLVLQAYANGAFTAGDLKKSWIWLMIFCAVYKKRKRDLDKN